MCRVREDKQYGRSEVGDESGEGRGDSRGGTKEGNGSAERGEQSVRRGK